MLHNASPLALLNHRFLVFECHATAGEQTDGALALKTQQELSRFPEDLLHWLVTLTVEFTPEKTSTYRGQIRIQGEFQIHESFDEQNHEALIRVTATSILYGACREVIANFTARSIHGYLSLPTISFRQPK